MPPRGERGTQLNVDPGCGNLEKPRLGVKRFRSDTGPVFCGVGQKRFPQWEKRRTSSKRIRTGLGWSGYIPAPRNPDPCTKSGGRAPSTTSKV